MRHFPPIRYLILVVVLGWVAGSVQAAALEDVQGLYEQGRYVQAREQAEALLQEDPDAIEVRFLLGKIIEREGDVQRAAEYYRGVLAAVPDHHRARLRLGRILLSLGRIERAVEMLRYVQQRQPHNERARLLEAAIMARQGQVSEAMARAEALVAEDDGNADGVVLLAKLYNQQGRPGKAEDLLRKALNQHGFQPSIAFSLANSLAKQGRLEEAEALYGELVSREPDVLPYALQLATLYASAGKLDRAERVLRQAVQREPSNEWRIVLLADFLASRRSPMLAEQELVSAIFAHPESTTLRIVLAQLYENINNFDGAIRVYREIAARAQNEPLIKDMKTRAASLLWRQGAVDEAQALVTEVLDLEPGDTRALLVQARIDLSNDRPERAIEGLREILGRQSEPRQALGLLLQAYVSNNQPDKAEQRLRRHIADEPRDVGLRMELIGLLTRLKEYERALAEVDELLKMVPENGAALERKTVLHRRLEDWPAAKAAAERLITADPNHYIGYYHLGQVALGQGKTAEAVRAFRDALERSPRDSRTLNAYVEGLLDKGQLKTALADLETLVEHVPDHPTAYNILGDLYVRQSNHTAAEAAYRKAYQLNPTWLRPYKNLARLYTQRGESEAAIQVYRDGLTAIPDSIQLGILLGMAYEQVEKYDQAIDVYEDILNKRPSMDVAANNLAGVLIRGNGDPQSLVRAQQVVARFADSKSPIFLDTYGWVAYKNGETDKAVQVLEKVISLKPDMPLGHYHLGMVYRGKNKTNLARKHLRIAVDSEVPFPGFEEAKRVLGRLDPETTPPKGR